MKFEIDFVDNFSKIYSFKEEVGKGRYGIVKKSRVKKEKNNTETYYACKIVKRKNDYLREVDHLLTCKECKGVLPIQKVLFTTDSMLMQFPLGKSFVDYIESKLFTCLHSHLEYTIKNCIYLLKTVREIHKRGIVHRDIKPSNIILWDESGNVEKPYLIDFGYSKRIKDLVKIPDNYDIVTSTYRAPELFNLVGEEHYGPLIDEWSTHLTINND